MSHADNSKFWREHAKKNGWPEQSYPAPHDWLLGRFGINCPPGIFWPAWVVGVLTGILFALSWGTLMYLSAWAERTIDQVALPSLAGGAGFGLLFAGLHWYQRRKIGWLTWTEFLNGSKAIKPIPSRGKDADS